MPGFNQRGPMNEGPMTGRGRGTCTGSLNPDQEFTGRGNARGMGRGFGRRGGGYGQRTTSAPGSVSQEALQKSMDLLEAELAAIKNQLKNLSESRE